MAYLEIKNLTKIFDNGAAAVRDVSLAVEKGDFCTVAGESGCGKTTLLKLIAGVVEPTSGSIFIGGKDVTTTEARFRKVAMVFQDYALYPYLTAAQNIGIGLKIRGASKEYIREKTHAAAELLGITALLERKPHQLSGGEKQRVALGRAIVGEPDLFLFDEPLSNLDQSLRQKLRDEIRELHDRLNATFIYVTHDTAEALSMGNRIAVMRGGRLLQQGAPYEVFAAPNDVFVAETLSPISFLRAEISQGTVYVCGEAVASKDAADGEIKLGVRRDAACVGGELKAEYRYSEFDGRVNTGFFRTAAGDVAVETDIRRDVGLKLDADKLLYFDKDGKRII